MSDSSQSIKMMRRGALLLLASLVVIFIFISISSFAGRDRPDPYTVKPLGTDAVEGKRVFQAYDCMDCHTVVGNGAYFAPDLTYVYQDDGPAWTMAFLSQLKVWPTKPMVDSQIDSLKAKGLLDVASREAYYEKWPTAVDDAADRGDWQILMPDLHLTPQEQIALTAWLAQLHLRGEYCRMASRGESRSRGRRRHPKPSPRQIRWPPRARAFPYP
jgi:hypothetical protein